MPVKLQQSTQLTMDFGERFDEANYNLVDKAVKSLLTNFASLGLSAEIVNRLMGIISEENATIKYHTEKK